MECKIAGCDRPTKTRGWCRMHYLRWWKTGDPGGADPLRRHGEPEDRFWPYVDKTGDCWIWTGSKDSRGYGRFNINHVSPVQAHRFSYEATKGPIAQGLVIDHICHNPPCVRPEHLQTVTQQQNTENPSRLRSDNTTGLRGVFYDRRKQPLNRRWYVKVRAHGVTTWGGRYETREEAAEAALALRLRLHSNNLLDRR